MVKHMRPWYSPRKVAQVAAFFAQQERGTINVLKLTKLIYLADREHMKKYDSSITNDEFVSMPHGPVNSMTNQYINGQLEMDGWDEFIADRAGYSIGLAKSVTEEMLDELSDAELQTLKEVWEEFGGMDKYTIRDWTHKHCPEWEDPNGSSCAIPYARVFKFLGKQDAELIESRIKEERALMAKFAI